METTDYISRETAIRTVCEDCEYYRTADCEECRLARLDDIPAADVRPIVKGEWVKNKDRVGWHCSVCKVDNNFAYSWNSETGKVEFQDNYCPCCGADMRGTDE